MFGYDSVNFFLNEGSNVVEDGLVSFCHALDFLIIQLFNYFYNFI